MSWSATLNGQPRKQLSDQLDRLDGIIDLLEEGLASAVRDAMKEGCQAALKDAILELFTHPEILETVRSAVLNRKLSFPESTVKPSWRQRFLNQVKNGMATAGNWIKRLACKIADRATTMTQSVRVTLITVDQQIHKAKERVSAVVRAMSLFCQIKQLAVISTAVGFLAGLVAYLAPHELAALAGGVGGATTAAGVQLGISARSFMRKLQMLNG